MPEPEANGLLWAHLWRLPGEGDISDAPEDQETGVEYDPKADMVGRRIRADLMG